MIKATITFQVILCTENHIHVEIIQCKPNSRVRYFYGYTAYQQNHNTMKNFLQLYLK